MLFIDTTERNKLLAEARNYYSKAYNLMKNDYRSLNFGPDEPVLARLVNRLPVIMAQCKIEYHEINKVKETLKVTLFVKVKFLGHQSFSNCERMAILCLTCRTHSYTSVNSAHKS